jgi:N-acetylmuramic acid 6-phosphate etherase
MPPRRRTKSRTRPPVANKRERRRAPRYLTAGHDIARAPDADRLGSLTTEQLNPAAADLDLKPTREILAIINREDATVAAAVAKAIPQIGRAVESVTESLHLGGRLVYVGAGTSGRLGVLDASECPPTFNVSPQVVIGVIAGGKRALVSAVEKCEDDVYLGRRDLLRLRLDERDTVIGITASGRTPYTIAALDYAHACGATTVALVCTAGSPLAKAADIAIEVVTGPEVISGSTRMKAGTAQKLVLNMISTTAMVRSGHVFGNLMVNVRQANQKLVARAERILSQATGLPAEDAQRLLATAEYDVKAAILMHLTGATSRAAHEALEAAGGNLRAALQNTPRADG